MPLFKCSKCNCIENTALGAFWGRDEKLCSECDTGRWHGRFDKKTPEEAGYVMAPNGLYYTEEQMGQMGFSS